jgi:hypothetical protein
VTNLGVVPSNAALDALGNTAPSVNYLGFASCHTGSPGTTGLLEYSGVTRLAATFGGASGGAKANTGTLSFTTSGVTAVTDFGFWSLVTAGVFGIGAHLSSTVTAVTITVAAGAISLAAS